MTDKMEETAIRSVKHMVIQHFKDKNVRIYLFGSWARGEQKRSSDIDIAIEISVLREKLEDSTIPRRVDIVDMNHAGQALCQRIRKEGIVWKELRNDMN